MEKLGVVVLILGMILLAFVALSFTTSQSGVLGGLVAEDEGTFVGIRPVWNFVGAGVTVTEDAPGNSILATITGASTVRELWLEPAEDPTGTVGNWDIVEINASQDVHFNFQIPGDFASLVLAEVVIIPDATETIQWDIDTSVSAAGEDYNFDDRAAVDETQVVTINDLTDLDISGVLASLSPGDHVAVDFQSDTNNIRIVGLAFEYN